MFFFSIIVLCEKGCVYVKQNNRILRHSLQVKNTYLYGPMSLPILILFAWVVIAIRNYEKGTLLSFSVIVLLLIVIYMVIYVKRWIAMNQHNTIFIYEDGLELNRFKKQFTFKFSKMSNLKLYDVRHKRVHVDVFEFTYNNQPFVILSQGYDRKIFRAVFSDLIATKKEVFAS